MRQHTCLGLSEKSRLIQRQIPLAAGIDSTIVIKENTQLTDHCRGRTFSMIDRRRFVGLAAASALALPVSSALAQQAWPSHFVRAVVPFPPSGTVDIVARMIAPHVSKLWGQQVVVENRPGAGGNIGNEAVARAEPDGYTMLFTQGSVVVNKFLYPSLNYDPEKDFTAVSLLLLVPNVLVVPKSSPIMTVQQFVAYAKANKVLYASAGNGTSSHLCGELLKRRIGVEMTHVPYRGTSLVINDLISGRVEATIDNVSALLPHIQSGNLRALAVTTPEPVAVLPGVMPMAAGGVPDFNVSAWAMALVPAKTPVDIVNMMQAGLNSALSQPETKQRLEGIGGLVMGSTPAETARFLQLERDTWGPVIRDANIKIGG